MVVRELIKLLADQPADNIVTILMPWYPEDRFMIRHVKVDEDNSCTTFLATDSAHDTMKEADVLAAKGDVS